MNALVDPGAIGMNIFGAFKAGQQERERSDYKNALAQYATAPTEQGLAPLARHAPEFVIQERGRLQQQAQAQQERQIVGAALQGDPQARQQLAYVNSDLYLQLDDRGKAQLDDTYGKIGQAAFSILQMPKEQHGPALQQFLAQMQLDPAQLNLPADPTEALKLALAYAGKLEDWEKFAQPRYTPIGEAGLAGFQFGQPIQQGGQPQDFGNVPAPPPGFVLDQGGQPAQGNGPFGQ